MRFQLHISDAEKAYCDSLPLSSEAKNRLGAFVDEFITAVSDDFRLDPANRPTPGQPYFKVQHLILDVWGDGGLHTIDFHLRDDRAEAGELLVVFINYHPPKRR